MSQTLSVQEAQVMIFFSVCIAIRSRSEKLINYDSCCPLVLPTETTTREKNPQERDEKETETKNKKQNQKLFERKVNRERKQ